MKDDQKIVYFFEVDIQYLKELHDKLQVRKLLNIIY